MTQISDDDFSITDDEFRIADSELDFTKEDIKGIVVAPAPKSSKYSEQSVIVGVYFNNKSDKPPMYNGQPFYPSVLFGSGNYDRIYLGRLMNVEYVPLNKANGLSLFGYPEKKTSKGGTQGVKCPLSIRRFEDFDSSENELLVDLLFRIGFTSTVYWKNCKITVVEREYFMEQDKKKGDGYSSFIRNKLMAKKFNIDDIPTLSGRNFSDLKKEIENCTAEVLKKQMELVELSYFIANVKKKAQEHEETMETDKDYEKIIVNLPNNAPNKKIKSM
tara:strand:- start:3483 stop:4304 length:822 start_codon:yes stop_codon:yes gene_type:complete